MKTLTKTLLGLVALTATSPAMALTYNGTGSADSLDFRQATTRMQVDGRAGNDLIIGGRYSDTLRGGTGRDTIDGPAPLVADGRSARKSFARNYGEEGCRRTQPTLMRLQPTKWAH